MTTCHAQGASAPVDVRVVFPQPVKADDDVLFANFRHCKDHPLAVGSDLHVEDGHLRDGSSAVQHPIDVVKGNGSSKSTCPNVVVLHKASTEECGSGATVHHGYHRFLSLFADELYGDVEVLTMMIHFIDDTSI